MVDQEVLIGYRFSTEDSISLFVDFKDKLGLSDPAKDSDAKDFRDKKITIFAKWFTHKLKTKLYVIRLDDDIEQLYPNIKANVGRVDWLQDDLQGVEPDGKPVYMPMPIDYIIGARSESTRLKQYSVVNLKKISDVIMPCLSVCVLKSLRLSGSELCWKTNVFRRTVRLLLTMASTKTDRLKSQSNNLPVNL